MSAVIDLTGQTFGRLTVLERGPMRPGGRRPAVWVCRCRCGAVTTVASASLRDGRTVSCGCRMAETAQANMTTWRSSPKNLARLAERSRSPEHRAYMAEKRGPDSPSWRGDDVGYFGAHSRTVRTRGLATEHVCQDCTEPAAEWSYTEAPGEWSPDPAHYVPRCKSCHKRHDNLLRYLLGETG